MDERPASSQVQASEARQNFFWMAIWFSISHGTVTTPLIYATSVFNNDVGYTGNALLYVVTVLFALLVSVPAVHYCGVRISLLLAMTLYSMYVALFTLAVAAGSSGIKDSKDLTVDAMQWLCYMTGCAFGGVAAGLVWTAQGSFFSRSAKLVAEEEGRPREQMNTELAGQFAFWYLLCEVLAKLISSVLLKILEIQVWIVGIIYTVISIVAVGAMFRLKDVAPEEGTGAKNPKLTTLERLSVVAVMWKDPKLWLLSFMNISFGFSAAYMNGYFNAHYAKPAIGDKALGFVGSITVASAVVFTQVLSRFRATHTPAGKRTAYTIGAISFFSIPAIVLTACQSENQCKSWHWYVVFFYALQGMGRSVYESTNRAVFADFYPGDQTESAFANSFVQMSVASAICFFMSADLRGNIIAWMVLVAAVLTPGAYVMAERMRFNESIPKEVLDEDSPLLAPEHNS
eukprot:gnl/TRDRNA2_/TRDRNA2_190316_c0_seq1.p1 gnl/TRDRNA2_/TRDRNA2_190316_c0~~gnl/TRDRNA2_/TRDRNA2_190316_c0_seq1.p1  ORF type:complete len:458 (+),score=67.69 gnl/TRDRNA2_/TRDRNA2_190316_c0_seq1:100-1473(+)